MVGSNNFDSKLGVPFTSFTSRDLQCDDPKSVIEPTDFPRPNSGFKNVNDRETRRPISSFSSSADQQHPGDGIEVLLNTNVCQNPNTIVIFIWQLTERLQLRDPFQCHLPYPSSFSYTSLRKEQYCIKILCIFVGKQDTVYTYRHKAKNNGLG